MADKLNELTELVAQHFDIGKVVKEIAYAIKKATEDSDVPFPHQVSEKFPYCQLMEHMDLVSSTDIGSSRGAVIIYVLEKKAFDIYDGLKEQDYYEQTSK